jgi:hypothetical protein
VKVESQAGKFILSFERMEPGDDQVVITGKMGVWDAKTYVSFPEFFGILLLTLRPRMLLCLLRALLRGKFLRRPPGPA